MLAYSSITAAKKHIKTCLIDQPAYCSAACPFGIDVRDFTAKMSAGRFNAAYRAYCNAVGFPSIVSKLCDEPCKGVCPREAPIELRLLEAAACELSTNTKPNSYNLPNKGTKIAMVGAGLSALGCALRLCNRKYEVSIFERTSRLGGRLWDMLPPELFLSEIEKQFSEEEYEIFFNREIFDPVELLNSGFNAVFLSCGTSDASGIFSCAEGSAAENLAAGLRAADEIEMWLKTGIKRQSHRKIKPEYKLDPLRNVAAENAVAPNNENYDNGEAAAEAKRCLRCRCDSCVRHCPMMSYFEKSPKRIEDEVEVTINPGTLDGNGTVATRLISTCSQCGLCKEVCPLSIDTGDFLRLSHIAMRDKGAMPWGFHEFFLRDMEAANSEHFFASPVTCEYVFYPGCRMGSSLPDYVTEPFRFLRKHMDAGIMLGCCGAPAIWAGDLRLQEGALSLIREHWERMGRPVFVVGCPSCLSMFSRYLPEIKTISLYETLFELGLIPKENEIGKEPFAAVFDPCSARHDSDMQRCVRKLAEAAGYSLKPLSYEGRYAQCCSWGGQIALTNPPYADWLAEQRCGEVPYICYCVNCRDIFASRGKGARHILDVMFGLGDWSRKSPGLRARFDNRVSLIKRISDEFYPGAFAARHEDDIKITMSGELAAKLEYITDDDIKEVLKTKLSIYDTEKNCRISHSVIGHTTVWVEYREIEDGFELLNAYSHRMSIEEK